MSKSKSGTDDEMFAELKFSLGQPVMELHPGKMYALEYEGHLSHAEIECLAQYFEEKTGSKCVVFEGGLKLARSVDFEQAVERALAKILSRGRVSASTPMHTVKPQDAANPAG